MSWNYRVVHSTAPDAWCLHEVYYDDGGNITSWTEAPVSFGSSIDLADLVGSLEMALRDAREREVLEEFELPVRSEP